MATLYALYLLISLAVTVWAGRSLRRNGYVMLADRFKSNPALAESINHLLVVGFYLVNFGMIAFSLSCGDKPNTLDQSVEYLATKEGFVILFVGVTHFFNIGLIKKYRRFEAFPAPAKTAV
jgi:hypothetical protein